MNLIIRANQVSYLFLWLSLGYYLGFVSFLGNLSKGGYQGGFESAASGSILNQLVGLSLLALVLFFVIYLKRINISHFLRTQLPWVLLLGYFVASIAWSEVSFISFRRLIAFSTLVLTAYTLTQLFDNLSLLKLISNIIFGAVVIGMIFSLVKGVSLSFGLGERGAAFRGIYFDKNMAARVYSYGIMFFIALKRYRTGSELIMLSLLCLALLLSQSASAIVMTALGIALITGLNLFKGKEYHQSLARLVVLFFIIAAGIFLVSILYEYLLSLLGRDPNLTNRAIIWELITPLIDDKAIFGYGFGAFWASDAVSGFIERWGFIGNAHSGYFETMLNGGYVATGLLILLLFSFFRAAIFSYLRSSSKNIAIIALTILIVQIVVNYVGFVVLNHNSVDMFIFCILYFVVINIAEKSQIQEVKV